MLHGVSNIVFFHTSFTFPLKLLPNQNNGQLYPLFLQIKSKFICHVCRIQQVQTLQWNAYLQALTNSAKKVLGEQQVSKEIKQQ